MPYDSPETLVCPVKVLGEIPTGSLQTGAPNRLQSAIFRPISRYIPETLQDKYIVEIWKANRNLYALYQMALFSVTHNYPSPNHHIFHILFCIPFHIFVVGEDGDFKFGRQVDSSKSWPKDDKTSLRGQITLKRGVVRVTWTHFKFSGLGPPMISLKRLKLESSLVKLHVLFQNYMRNNTRLSFR